MQKWLLNLIIVGASFLGIQMISGELEQRFYFQDILSPKEEKLTKMENEQRHSEKSNMALLEQSTAIEVPSKENAAFKEGEAQGIKASEQSPTSTQKEEGTGVKTQPKNDTMVSTLNAMGLSELQTLKGVGPVTAQRILDYKTSQGPFNSLEELLEVKGIGPKKLESIKASLQSLQK